MNFQEKLKDVFISIVTYIILWFQDLSFNDFTTGLILVATFVYWIQKNINQYRRNKKELSSSNGKNKSQKTQE